MVVIISTVVVSLLLVLGALLGSSWGFHGLRRLKHVNAMERRELNEEWLLLREARAQLGACGTCPLRDPASPEAAVEVEVQRVRRVNGQPYL